MWDKIASLPPLYQSNGYHLDSYTAGKPTHRWHHLEIRLHQRRHAGSSWYVVLQKKAAVVVHRIRRIGWIIVSRMIITKPKVAMFPSSTFLRKGATFNAIYTYEYHYIFMGNNAASDSTAWDPWPDSQDSCFVLWLTMQTLLSLTSVTRLPLPLPTCQRLLLRKFSTMKAPIPSSTLRRSYLYVPSSSDKMLEKTKTSDSDIFVYDLEDSVAPNTNDKVTARERLKAFLTVEFYSFLSEVLLNIVDLGFTDGSDCELGTCGCTSEWDRYTVFRRRYQGSRMSLPSRLNPLGMTNLPLFSTHKHFLSLL